jgi:hypothetical protein
MRQLYPSNTDTKLLQLPRYTTAKTLKEAVNRMRDIAIHSGKAKSVPAV